jgi:hypothetical protein
MSTPTTTASRAFVRRITSNTALKSPAIRQRTRPVAAFTLQQHQLKASSSSSSSATRSFSIAMRQNAGLMPETSNPQPPSQESLDSAKAETKAVAPTAISVAEYHEHADRYMDAVHEKAEQVQESREDVEVEYSVSLSLPIPPLHPTLPFPYPSNSPHSPRQLSVPR